MTKLYDERDDFSFRIVSFTFIYGNIHLAPAYGVFISKLIRYARACGKHAELLFRVRLLTSLFLYKIASSLEKYYGRHHEFVVYPYAM